MRKSAKNSSKNLMKRLNISFENSVKSASMNHPLLLAFFLLEVPVIDVWTLKARFKTDVSGS